MTAPETLRVLIVEDEELMRAAVNRALSRYTLRLDEVEGEFRFLVEEAGSAEEGWEKIQASPPDLVLLDHKLPGMSGVELLGILAEKMPDQLTIMMTAYATLETAVTATKRGAYDFLAKPFTPEELKSVVGKAIRHLLLTREARRLAQEKKQLRFQFISVLVHELKAPLAAIQGYLQILRDQPEDDPDFRKHAVVRSLTRAEGMWKLITDLLDLTRLESGQKKRELVEVDLCELARASVETVSSEARERDITVSMHSPAQVPVTADRGEMEIILNNLLTNAVKYNRDHGRVDLTLKAAEGWITIQVSDTGIGMTREECERLFQEFVRIRNAKTRSISGSGLGLSILRKLARVYGGDVTVESEPDVGTTFTVVFSQTLPAELMEEA